MILFSNAKKAEETKKESTYHIAPGALRTIPGSGLWMNLEKKASIGSLESVRNVVKFMLLELENTGNLKSAKRVIVFILLE